MIYLGKKINCVKNGTIISRNLLTSPADYSGETISTALYSNKLYIPVTTTSKEGIKIRKSNSTYSIENVVPTITITGSHSVTSVSGTYYHDFTITKITLSVSLHSGITILASTDRSTWYTIGAISKGSYSFTSTVTVHITNTSGSATIYFRVISDVSKTARTFQTAWLASSAGINLAIIFGTGISPIRAGELRDHRTSNLVPLTNGSIYAEVTCYSTLLIPVKRTVTLLTRGQSYNDTAAVNVPIPTILYATIDVIYSSGIENDVTLVSESIYAGAIPVTAKIDTVTFMEITGGGGVIVDTAYTSSVIGTFNYTSEIQEAYW